MTLSLRGSFGVSMAVHALGLALFAFASALFAPRLPRITEITLVTGDRSAAVATQGAGLPETAGGQSGVSASKPVKAVSKGHVNVANPEFVPIGNKPKRSGDRLMGAQPGTGGGLAAGSVGAGTGAATGGRKLRHQEPLEYPDWAKEQGVDAKVTLQFRVLAAGSVDSQILVKRTSGWRQLDELAIKSLREFLFEPLPPSAPQVPQWGELTFHFKPE